MTPKSADPSRYKLHVVSFSVVREAAPEPGPRPTLNGPNAVAHLARQIIADDAKEHFWALLLDSQNGLIAAHEVSTGTLSASLVHPREVFGPALRIMGVASVQVICRLTRPGRTPDARSRAGQERRLDLGAHSCPATGRHHGSSATEIVRSGERSRDGRTLRPPRRVTAAR